MTHGAEFIQSKYPVIDVDNVVIREEEFGGIIFDSRTPRCEYYLTNRYTLKILKKIDGTTSLEDIKREFGYNAIKIIDYLAKNNMLFFQTEDLWKGNPVKTLNENNTSCLQSPFLITINPSIRCEMNCNFCYVTPSMKNACKELSIEQYKFFINEMVDCGVCLLDIFGGEPFLYPQIYELLRYVSTKPLNVVISTNGLAFEYDKLSGLEKFFGNKITFNISLHSGEEKNHDQMVGYKGAFNVIINKIKTLVEHKVRFNVSAVVTKENLKNIESLLVCLKKLNHNSINFLFYHEMKQKSCQQDFSLSVWDFYNFKKNITHLNKYKYGGYFKFSFEYPFFWVYEHSRKPEDNFALKYYSGCLLNTKLDVLTDGSIVPCIHLIPYVDKLGNIKRDSIKQIWLSPKLNKFRKRVAFEIKKCNNCEYQSLCKNQCLAYVLSHNGDFFDRDPRCNKGDSECI